MIVFLVRVTMRNVRVVLASREPFVTRGANGDAHERVAVMWLVRKAVVFSALVRYAVRPVMYFALMNLECRGPRMYLGGVICAVALEFAIYFAINICVCKPI